MATPRSTDGDEEDPRELSREAAMIERIGASADARGFVPFDRFMELALYSDGIGYYSGPANPLGTAGDFYTAPHVSPLFGRSIARRVRQIRATFPPGGSFRIAEVGPGDGTLASTIVQELGREPESCAGVSYFLVERSLYLRATSLERVREVGDRLGIPVAAEDALGATGPFAGVVIAHEVLDAQPVRRLIYRPDGWHELGVRSKGGRLAPAESALMRSLPRDPPALPEVGEIWEYAPGTAACLRAISDHLTRGVAIVIDFGMERAELRSAHPTGTLAAVRRHRTVDEPWSHPGRLDLSTFVDFTGVRADAARFGLRELSYSSQADALGRWGFEEILREALGSAPSAEARVKVQLAAKSLLFGFERFRVVELGAPGPA